MAIAFWPTGFGDSDECSGAGTGALSVAPKNGTTEVWLRSSPDWIDWSKPPILVADFGATEYKQFRVHYDGVYVTVTNGVDRIWRSKKYDTAGSFSEAE